MTPSRQQKITKGSQNVFADLGLPNPEEALAKANLAREISAAIKQKKLTQEKAGQLLGVDQPKVSAIMRGHLSGFSTERLIRFLNVLGRDVDIVVKAKPRSRNAGQVRVLGA